jgi:hypothetical protein
MFTVQELIDRVIFASIRLDKYPSLDKSEKDYANREIFRKEWQEAIGEATQEFLFMEEIIKDLENKLKNNGKT